ncbi:MAG: 3-dehydroquinate synthase [Herbinix sp.]|nr:3-dehydroquinate synthase [Herbinix sp.]
MNRTITVNYENKPAYDIMLEPDFDRLTDAIVSIALDGRRFMIVTDSNVGNYYLSEIHKLLVPYAKEVHDFVFPAGEASKNLSTVSRCYEQLILSGFDRNDVLIALGGGVVGDLTGFVAATYLRGIRFIQVPTSLLSMVDSSIGGKTGVDFKAYKNMVGAFHQPKLVYMNLSSLHTLPEAEYNSGMGEIIKHGLIKDSAYYSWLKVHHNEITSRDFETMKEMISQSCLIKKDVVENDPKEQGERALLNFGHTIGHSIEKLMDLTLLHGECVSIGMAAAAFISLKRGYFDEIIYNDILDTLKLFKQPYNVAGLSTEEVYEVTKMDKKMDSGKIKFILLREIGCAEIDSTISKDEMSSAINSVLV